MLIFGIMLLFHHPSCAIAVIRQPYSPTRVGLSHRGSRKLEKQVKPRQCGYTRNHSSNMGSFFNFGKKLFSSDFAMNQRGMQSF